MKNETKNKQTTLRTDPAQNDILVWSALASYLEEESKPVGPKCPIYTF